MILDGLYFLEDATSTGDSIEVSNTKGSILVLQVKCSSNFEFSIQGSLDANGENYVNIAAINMSDLSVATSISAEGVYQADVSGLRKVKLSVSNIGSGALTVYGIIKEG